MHERRRLLFQNDPPGRFPFIFGGSKNGAQLVFTGGHLSYIVICIERADDAVDCALIQRKCGADLAQTKFDVGMMKAGNDINGPLD